ncbi:hypothetical protein ACFR9U_18745 [Halorientalis brevis]|uniref:Archaeal histidine kinase 4TM domain-containing protein n=1 Tax=Halorientalis brevis TaxID=1126241 RepID=A0ABD6CGR3_9EURY|nr:hypothetical protein [Halorientalis brevis]
MQRQAQGATIAVSGLLLAGVQLVHATSRTQTTVGFLIDGVPFVLMALAITYAGYWVLRGTDDEHTTIVGAWALGGAVGFAAISALLLTSMNVALDTFPVFESAPAIAIDSITVGILAGVLVGVYDARSRTRLAELERQRDRIEGFANRAADMNNYGRALNECATVEEVSALCIEAVATLVDITDTAFVERRGEMATIVDATIVGVPDETIAEMAMRGRDAELATVVTHTEDVPATLDGVESLLTIRVAETEHSQITIVALNRGSQEITDETKALLEMLVSHAGTALENIYSPSHRVGDGNEQIDIEFEAGREK